MDHYEVLEVEREASQEQIKTAWRQAQIRWHPDKNRGNPSAEERFKQAGEAYSVLSDPDKRRIYDLGVRINPDGGFDPSMFDPSILDPDDLIRSFVKVFGVYIDERIPGFREAAKSAAKNVAKSQAKKDAEKNARKQRKASNQYRCAACKDTKRIRMRQGGFEISIECRRCGREN